jgi:hypothetical protein
MKLPIIEALRTIETGKVIPITGRVSVAREVPTSPNPSSYDRAIEFNTSAKFEMRQISMDKNDIHHLHKQAARAMTKEIYGPVSDRLHDILHMLWENGPLYDDKIVKAVESLIEDLRP